MYSFMQLTLNEWTKLTKKRGFFIAYLIMFLMPLGMAIVIKSFLDGTELGYVDFMRAVIDLNGGGSIYVFLCMIYTASLVSGEHQLGTIKLLLIRPHSRSKILASKYVALLLYNVVLLLFAAIVSFIVAVLFFGMQGDSSIVDILKSIVYTLVYTVMYTSIVFMFSVVTKSTGATIGIAFCLVFIESLVVLLLAKYEFSKYILFLNLDLSMYEEGGVPLVQGMTLGFSITVLAAYLIAILAIAFVVFKKRDVA